MNFSAIVKKYRADYGMSQKATAKLLGISRNYLSQIEFCHTNALSYELGDKILNLPRLANKAVEEDPDCCEAWPQIVDSFSWLSLDTSPDMLTTPYIHGKDDKQWIVNFCPLCGANARNRMMKMQRVDE